MYAAESEQKKATTVATSSADAHAAEGMQTDHVLTCEGSVIQSLNIAVSIAPGRDDVHAHPRRVVQCRRPRKTVGIGTAAARLFSALGAAVVLASRNIEADVGRDGDFERAVAVAVETTRASRGPRARAPIRSTRTSTAS